MTRLPETLLLETPALTLEDSKRHLPFSFQCPAGVQALRLHWAFDPPGAGELRTLITLSVQGPGGFRGAGHRHGSSHEVEMTAYEATPGYLAGPILPGPWTVTLHAHLVMGHTSGTLRVTAVHGPEAAAPLQAAAPSPSPALPASGWMRGDLHCHTRHSDGRWTPPELAAAATRQGLSFLALTDHNTVSGRDALAAAFPGVLLPGTELTTYHGHALVLGQQAFPDWTRLEPQRGMAELARRVEAGGGYLVIAHPFAAGDPLCTGCAWTYFDLRPENATHLEVWNGPWDGRHNERALAYWYDLLGSGRRVVATAGSDAHGPAYLPGVGFTCTPGTDDPAVLLTQLRAGRTYLSAGPELRLVCASPQGPVSLGGTGAAGRWQGQLAWDDVPAGSELTWVVDGRRQPREIAESGTESFAFEVEGWLNLELRGATGELLALTNPLYTRR
ncbi:CehA/McbA family metallohydrolase [Deinococcus sp.]|uniref:CehA/McbA family metallohydrolase n=1 Tax=Deinococcus sp. TaxID=47478 RepID=UPI003C7E71A5